MAAIWLLFVLVTMPVHRILAANCNSESYMNCDQCIQCGNTWCINPGENKDHCISKRSDESCKTPDNLIYPSVNPSPDLYREEKTALVGTPTQVTFTLPVPAIDQPSINYTTKVPQVVLKHYSDANPYGVKLTYTITVKDTFCTDGGEDVQNFTLSVKYKGNEDKIGVHVPCACECTKHTSKKDIYCSGRGDLVCGACRCDGDWEGERCEKRKPYNETEYVEPADRPCSSRGDTADCIHHNRPTVDCSGNGICSECCKCDKNKEGWQYFDSDDYCADLCLSSSIILEEDYNSTLLYIMSYDQEVLNQTDSQHRRIWVQCNETIHDMLWKYYARKNSRGEIAVMVLNTSDPNAAAVVGVNVTALAVPLAIATLLALTAVGYFVWQSKGAAPQPSRANYQGLDGPKTRVETNPVYIEPIKSYKNPTYGQNP